ncbi:TonB-dependent receptor [uncultured Roseobacter sp.]|uniref:TonB-dependent receptor n=1 Tax=uncultured Roseobacter sp. TaxID=114847 RepID=UPI002626DD11|nr:TonB-dependent receptor [uncultured Roseobacter sp.]
MKIRRDGAYVAVIASSLSLVAGSAFGQDIPFDLGVVVLRGDKVERDVEDAPPSTTVILGDVAAKPSNRDIDDVIGDEANVLASEGFIPPAIRGVGGLGGDRPAITAGARPRVPVLVDDVPLPSGEASNITQTSGWDIDSVEVARGPQAASTGRNTLGGAIRVYTKDPVFEREGALRFLYTDQQEAETAFMLNTPLVEDQLAFRLVGEFGSGDSYIQNGPNPLPAGFDPNDESSERLRAKLLFEPAAAPRLKLLFSAERSKAEGPTEGFFNGDIEDLSVSGVFALASSYEEVDQTVYSSRLTYDLSDRATFVARISSSDNELRFLNTGETPFGFSFGETGFDKELAEAEAYLQFSDVGIVTSGVLGIIRSVEDEKGFNDGLLAFSVDGRIENTGLFGEVELDASAVAQGLSVILGGRYEKDKRTRTSLDGSGALVGTATFSENVFLPKLGLRYEVNERTTLGYTYSEGFRGGGLDVDLGAALSPAAFSSVAFAPEYLKQHEVYAQTTALDGALDLSATAFFYQWQDAQVSGAAAYPISGDSAIGNIPEAEGMGLELSAVYRMTDEFSVSGGLGLLDAEITQVSATQTAFLGQKLPLSPEATASLGVAYQGRTGFDASAQLRFVGSRTSALNQSKLDSFTVVDVSAGYETELAHNQIFRVDVFVDNLFDERYQTFTEATSFGGLNIVGKPRTVGVSATWRF